MFGNSRDGCTTLENLRSTIQGHRDGHTTTHSPQSQATDRLLNKSCGAFWGGASVSALLAGLALSLSIASAPAAAHPQPPRSQTASTAFVQQPACRPLCPWMADRPLFQGRSANKERTPLPRAGWSCVSPSLASHPQVFHGGCFGVYGTPPREAVWFCEIGTKIPLVPRVGVGTLRIRWLSWLTFGWRVQTCSQVLAWCLKTAPPGVCLAAWPRCRLQSMPGFFRAVRGCGGQAADGFKRVG